MTHPNIPTGRLSNEPAVAENIIFATTPYEAKAIADGLGVSFDKVQWFRSPDMLGDMDVSASKVHYSPQFTHRADYAQTRERVKVQTGVGRRVQPETAGRTAVR